MTNKSNRYRDFVNSSEFQEMLKFLASKIRSLDSVRDINLKDDFQTIAVKQLAKKIALETIEEWLSEVLGVVNMNDFVDTFREEQDDIIINKLKK